MCTAAKNITLPILAVIVIPVSIVLLIELANILSTSLFL